MKELVVPGQLPVAFYGCALSMMCCAALEALLLLALMAMLASIMFQGSDLQMVHILNKPTDC